MTHLDVVHPLILAFGLEHLFIHHVRQSGDEGREENKRHAVPGMGAGKSGYTVRGDDRGRGAQTRPQMLLQRREKQLL